MTHQLDNREIPTVGLNLHRRAERILGKREYDETEYLAALEQAEVEAQTDDSVDELAEKLLRVHPALGNLDAARVLARTRLRIDDPPQDLVQREAERIAKSRGLSIEQITDYGKLRLCTAKPSATSRAVRRPAES